MKNFTVHSREVATKNKGEEDEHQVVLETFENTNLGKTTEDKEFARETIEKALEREQGRLDALDNA